MSLTDLDQILGLIVGISQVVTMWLAGSGRLSAWIVALVGNAFWYWYVYTVGTVTLYVLVVIMTCVYTRNLVKAVRKKNESKEKEVEHVRQL